MNLDALAIATIILAVVLGLAIARIGRVDE